MPSNFLDMLNNLQYSGMNNHPNGAVFYGVI